MMTTDLSEGAVIVPRKIHLGVIVSVVVIAIAAAGGYADLRHRLGALEVFKNQRTEELQKEKEALDRMEAALCQICKKTVGDGGCKNICHRFDL